MKRQKGGLAVSRMCAVVFGVCVLDAVDLASVSVDFFSPHVGQAFEVLGDDGEPKLELTLREATSRGQGGGGFRAPFSLQFAGPAEPFLSQGMFALVNSVVGRLDIFLVPVRGDSETRTYEAVFA